MRNKLLTWNGLRSRLAERAILQIKLLVIYINEKAKKWNNLRKVLVLKWSFSVDSAVKPLLILLLFQDRICPKKSIWVNNNSQIFYTVHLFQKLSKIHSSDLLAYCQCCWRTRVVWGFALSSEANSENMHAFFIFSVLLRYVWIFGFALSSMRFMKSNRLCSITVNPRP